MGVVIVRTSLGGLQQVQAPFLDGTRRLHSTPLTKDTECQVSDRTKITLDIYDHYPGGA